MSDSWYVSWRVPAVYGDTKLVIGPFKSHFDAEQQGNSVAACSGVAQLKVYFEDANDLMDGVLSEQPRN